MKTLVLSMISIAATVAAMTACTSESDEIDNIAKDAKVEIKMSAKVLNIETRSAGPIEGTATAIDNVAFVKQEAEENAAITWTTATPISATIEAGGNIKFTAPIYYPANEKTYAHLIGYHPLQNGVSITDGKVPFTITGNQDIMYAPVQKGNKAIAKQEGDAAFLKPQFEHKLSQLIIQIKGDEAAAAAWGNISSVRLKDISNELELNLSTGELLAKSGTTPAELALTLNTNYTLGAIPKDITPIGYSMVLPQNAAHKLIITTANYKDKEVDITIPASSDNSRPKDATVAGEAYTITITFSASNISATASITPWVKVSDGSGTVE